MTNPVTPLIHTPSLDACQTIDTDQRARAYEEAEAVRSRSIKRMEGFISIYDDMLPFMRDPFTAILSLPHCSERLSVLNKEIDSFLLQIKMDTELINTHYEVLAGKS